MSIDIAAATRRLMEREIAEIIKDIAAADPEQANELHGPYTSIFDHLRRYMLDGPFFIELDDPQPFIQALTAATDIATSTRIITRALVTSYFRQRRQFTGGSSGGWWNRLISIVEKGGPA